MGKIGFGMVYKFKVGELKMSGYESDDYEQWDADNLSVKDVELLYGEDAALGYANWIYLNLKQENWNGK